MARAVETALEENPVDQMTGQLITLGVSLVDLVVIAPLLISLGAALVVPPDHVDVRSQMRLTHLQRDDSVLCSAPTSVGLALSPMLLLDLT